MKRVIKPGIFKILLLLLTVFTRVSFADFSGNSNRSLADISSVPLAYVILSASDVEFVKPLVRTGDIIAAKPDKVELLGSLTGVQKLLLIGPGYERGDDGKWCAMSDEKITSLMKKARQYGVTLFGYNLENSFHGRDIIERERHVNELAHAAGMVHVFGPLIGRLMKQGGEKMAEAADIMVVQAQAFQRSTGFETKKVLEVVNALRKANPNVKVHIQISVRNRDNGTCKTVDEVIEDLGKIAGYADTVWLFSVPATTTLFREVFTKLRQSRPVSLHKEIRSVNPSAQQGIRSAEGKPFSSICTQAIAGDTRLSVLRNAMFATGSWVPYAILGGQIAGDCSPHLVRVLEEAGVTEEQRSKKFGIPEENAVVLETAQKG